MAKHQFLFSTFTADELEILAQLKRLFERMQCDSELLEAVGQNNVSTGQLKRLKETGILFDLSDFPFANEKQQNTMLFILAVSKNNEDELDDDIKQFAELYPLLKLWAKYNNLLCKQHSR